MENINDQLLKRLLNLSEQICIEEDALADLSDLDLENSEKFDEHIKKLTNLLDKQDIILNTISIQRLNNFSQILLANDKHSDSAIAFNRLFQLVQDKIDEYVYTHPKEDILDDGKSNKEETDEEVDEYDEEELITELVPNEEELPDSIEDEAMTIDDFYMDEIGIEQHLVDVLDRISIIVSKKMYERINSTKDDNKIETKYKKRLLKQLKQLKYYIFTEDYKLERLATKHRFNIDLIPIPEPINKDLTPIYHNEVINVLDRLYSTEIKNQKISDISILLFKLMCLEEYIKYLDDESLNKLLLFCQDMEQMAKWQNFGRFGRDKIKQRLRKNS